MMYFEVWKSGAHWYWHLKAANHEIVGSGQGYSSKQKCLHAVDLVKGSASAAVRISEEKVAPVSPPVSKAEEEKMPQPQPGG